MKYIIGIIICLMMAFPVYGQQPEPLEYSTAEINDLLDEVDARVSTSAGAADAGKMVVLDASGELDSSFGTGGGTGDVSISGTPVANDFARWTDDETIEGRSYAEAKGDLDLEIGTDIQAWDTDLDTYAGIPPSADIQTLLSSANYAAIKVNMDLEVGVDIQAYSADTTVLGSTIGAAEVDADVATQAEIDLKANLTSAALVTPTVTTSIAAVNSEGVWSTLGTTAAEFRNLYLGDAAVIYGQADQSNTITSSATGWSFNIFPITPSAAPDADYEVANKKYIDDAVIAAGAGDVVGVGDCADGACYDGSADGGTYARLYDGNSHYVQIAVPDVAGNVTITTPAVTSTLLAADGTGASLTAVDAITGDSATAFFDAGALETAFGGLGADASGVTGIVGLNAGAMVDVDTAAELETYAGLGAFANEYLDDANAAAVRVTLGLEIGVNVEAYDATIIKEADVDDTPVNGATTAPASSNYVYDHVAANDPHSTYLLKSQIGASYDTSAELDALFAAEEDALDNSAGLLAALDDETGTGVAVFSTSPTLVTPTLGVATATTINTGQGAVEAYAMDQPVQSTDAVAFTSVTLAYSPITGTADSGSATTMVDATLTKPDDYYNGMRIRNTSEGTTLCESVISDYVLSTGTVVFAALPASCTGNSTFAAAETYSIFKNTGFERDMLPDVDQTCSGDIMTVTAGATITWGMCLAVDRADSRWVPANAEASSGQGTDELVCRAFACEDGIDGDAIEVMVKGTARNDAWDLDVAGTATERVLVLNDVTAGLIQFTDGDGLDNVAVAGGVPSDAGDILQYLGWPITDDVLYFDPEVRPEIL